MPRKKEKPPHEMTDAELLRQVFPEEVAKEIEREVEETDADSPDKEESK